MQLCKGVIKPYATLFLHWDGKLAITKEKTWTVLFAATPSLSINFLQYITILYFRVSSDLNSRLGIIQTKVLKAWVLYRSSSSWLFGVESHVFFFKLRKKELLEKLSKFTKCEKNHVI